jgi:cellulose synthase/poly-beta-1,6-N-acetylglucosamine synthase-like glycosyltransferase
MTTQQNLVKLSIIIPCYNERKKLIIKTGLEHYGVL